MPTTMISDGAPPVVRGGIERSGIGIEVGAAAVPKRSDGRKTCSLL